MLVGIEIFGNKGEIMFQSVGMSDAYQAVLRENKRVSSILGLVKCECVIPSFRASNAFQCLLGHKTEVVIRSS